MPFPRLGPDRRTVVYESPSQLEADIPVLHVGGWHVIVATRSRDDRLVATLARQS